MEASFRDLQTVYGFTIEMLFFNIFKIICDIKCVTISYRLASYDHCFDYDTKEVFQMLLSTFLTLYLDNLLVMTASDVR